MGHSFSPGPIEQQQHPLLPHCLQHNYSIIVHLPPGPKKDKATERKWVLTLKHKDSGKFGKSLNESLRIFSSHWKNLRKTCSPCFAVRKIRSATAPLKVMLQEKNSRNLLKGYTSNFHCLWGSLITSAKYLMISYHLLWQEEDNRHFASGCFKTSVSGHDVSIANHAAFLQLLALTKLKIKLQQKLFISAYSTLKI